MAKPQAIETRLAEQGTRRRAAKQEAKDAMAEIRKLAPKAVNSGVPKLEVARLAQISRVTLDEILNR